MKHAGAGFRLFLKIEVDGKTVFRKQVSRSWVKAYTWILYAQMTAQTATLNDTGGTSRNVPSATFNLRTDDVIDSSNYGIVVGTGTGAVGLTNQALGTKIATGNGSGQLRYMGSSFNGPSTGSTVNSFDIIRSFVNNSGASITVQEVGMYGLGSASAFVFCLARDLTGGTVVAAGKTMTVTYTMQAGL